MSDPSGIRNRPRDQNRREAEVSGQKLGDSLPCDTCDVSGPLIAQANASSRLDPQGRATRGSSY
jgi:hypothetical protein